jgi:hypothetical protein
VVAICHYGGNDTEYGGFQPAGAPFKIQPADAVCALLAFYF